MTMDFEEFKRRSELINHSEEGELETMFSQKKVEEPKYDGKTFPEKEVDHIKMKALWEYLGYLEISLRCFNIALRYINSDFFMIKAQIANYGKSNIEDFIYGNDYIRRHNTPNFSFKIFNGYIRDNADIHYKMAFTEERFTHLKSEIKKNMEYQKGEVEEKNEILDRIYMLDDWPYIEPMNDKHKEEFLDFFTDGEVFENLYNLAKKEIEINDKKSNNRLSAILEDKLKLFNEAQYMFSNQLTPRLTNQYLINWLLLLQEYIDKTLLLLEKSTNPSIVDRQIAFYILKAIFEHCLEIDTKKSDFVSFTKRIMGTTTSTAEKYLRKPRMGSNEDVFTNDWLWILEDLDKLDTENPKLRDLIRTILKEPHRQTKGLTLENKNKIDRLTKKYTANN